MTIKKTWMAVVVAGLAVGGTALAGHKQFSQVSISNGQAWGTLGDARGSANITEYIGCEVFSPAGSLPLAICHARDEVGTALLCSSSDPGVVTAAQAFGPTAFVTFAAEKSGACRFVWATNMSFNTPPVQ
jgi:hypothetical protein